PDPAGNSGVERRDRTQADRLIEGLLDELGKTGSKSRHSGLKLAAGGGGLYQGQAGESPGRSGRLQDNLQSEIRLRAGIGFAGDGGFDPRTQQAGHAIEQRQENGLLIGEMKINAALGGL